MEKPISFNNTRPVLHAPAGTDMVHLISSTGTCGVDSALGGISYSGTGSATTLTFALGQISHGTYKVCHCPSIDGADVDSTACSSADEFTHDAGQLSVEGEPWLACRRPNAEPLPVHSAAVAKLR